MEAAGIATMAALAQTTLTKVAGLRVELFERLKEQAKLQSASTDYLYDLAGWAILVGLGVGLVVLSAVQKPK